jgi:uncharacterized delta-60 repeat protein
MAINLGDKTASNFYVGATGSYQIYQGDTKVWPPDYSALYIVGDFTTFNGVSSPRVARITRDGTLDTTFNVGSGINGTAIGSAIQSDKKLIVGGKFTAYNNVSCSSIVRINYDGTRDTTFNIGTGLLGGSGSAGGNNANNIQVQTDGKILVVGNFAVYSGSANNNIVRINTNGTKDTTFNVGVGFSPGGLFKTNNCNIQPDGKIVVVGNFTSYSGSAVNRIVRINTNGTKDTTFNIGTGFGNETWWSSLQPDGKIVVIGAFTGYSGSTNPGIVRLNTDGTKDTTFNVGTGLNGVSYGSTVQSDGKIVCVGAFTSYSGSAVNRIVRINTDGTRDTTFNVGTGLNAIGISVQQQEDGKIIVGGNFTTYSGSATPYLVRLNTDGTKDTTFISGSGPNAGVQGMRFI